MALGSNAKVILVVDDDSDDALLIGDAVRGAGPYTAVVCRNASEARAYLKGSGMYSERTQHPFPHGIICDMNLGGESGLEFLQWSKGMEEFRGLPVMMVTGEASPHELFSARKSGAAKVCKKPSRFAELQQAVSEFMRGAFSA